MQLLQGNDDSLVGTISEGSQRVAIPGSRKGESSVNKLRMSLFPGIVMLLVLLVNTCSGIMANASEISDDPPFTLSPAMIDFGVFMEGYTPDVIYAISIDCAV